MRYFGMVFLLLAVGLLGMNRYKEPRHPKEVIIYYDPEVKTYDTYCYGSDYLEFIKYCGHTISIKDAHSLTEFQCLYNRMKDSCFVRIDNGIQDETCMRVLEARYSDRIDTLVFLILHPSADIAVKDNYYTDSLMYYYTMYHICERDSAYAKYESTYWSGEPAYYMQAEAKSRYQKRVDAMIKQYGYR